MNTQRNTMYLTLGEAAKAVGKSKSVISKALKTGEISFVSKNDSGYKIDPAELFRVFPKNANENRFQERLETHENTVENTIKIKGLEVRLEAVSQERSFFKEQYAKLERDRDDWREQAQRLVLTHQKPAEVNKGDLATLPAKHQQKLSSGRIFGLLVGTLLGGIVVLLSVFWPEVSDHMLSLVRHSLGEMKP